MFSLSNISPYPYSNCFYCNSAHYFSLKDFYLNFPLAPSLNLRWHSLGFVFFINVEKSAFLGGNEDGCAWSLPLWTPPLPQSEHLSAIPSGEALVCLPLLRAGLCCHHPFRNRRIHPVPDKREINCRFRDPFFGHTKSTELGGEFSFGVHGWSAACPGVNPSGFHYGK